MKIKEISSYFMEKFPLENASDFDNGKLGFVIGDENRVVTGVLLALDLTKEVLEEALKKNCNFIVTHHPFLFFPTHKILVNTEKGYIINQMMKNDISLYSMHTNLDVGEGGVNDSLSSLLGFKNVKGEVAKDQFLRTGEIEPITLNELAHKCINTLHLTGCKIAGDPNTLITKVGIVGGGSGSEGSIIAALSEGVDCYICGEVRLSAAQLAKVNRLSLIELNHGIEKNVFPFLKEMLMRDLNEKVNIYVSEVETDPLIYIAN